MEWWKYWRGRSRSSESTSPRRLDDDDRRPLLNHRAQGVSYGTGRHVDVENQRRVHRVDPPESQSTPPYFPSTPSLNTSKPSSETSRGWLSLFLIYVICFIGWAIAASYSTAIPATKSGLSGSHPCGVWTLKPDVTDRERDVDDLDQTQKEIRAGQYARDCYGDQSIVRPGRCNFFENQTISYTTDVKQPCPFKDPSFCNGAYTAVRFSTGLIDAEVLGINSPRVPKFNRTTICVPLNMKRGFIKRVPPDNQFRFDYFLGSTNGSRGTTDYTFRQFGDPFKWDVPAYSVSAYESTPYPHHDYWLPLPELDRADHTYLTIMFIASCRIIYTGSSEDYIFHSNMPFLDSGKYWNPDPRARPLACVDSIEVCSSDHNCSNIDQQHEKHEKEYEFVRSALRKSTTFQSIRFRLGTALVAQEKVGDFVSLPLADDQWVVESKSLFETSLSRIQHDALDIATGVGHKDDPGPYRDETLDWARGRLCGIYKFQLPQGYTNLNLLATVGFVLLVVALIVLALQTPVEFDEEKKTWFRGRYMVFELAVWTVCRAFVLDFSPFKLFFRWIGAKTRSTWQYARAE